MSCVECPRTIFILARVHDIVFTIMICNDALILIAENCHFHGKQALLFIVYNPILHSYKLKKQQQKQIKTDVILWLTLYFP